MKLKTLVTRYKNIGYSPKGLERDLEIASIIKWVFEKYDIYVGTMYFTMKVNGGIGYHKFAPYKIWNTKEPYATTFHSESKNRYFDNPFDAQFKGLCETYRAIKFQFH